MPFHSKKKKKTNGKLTPAQQKLPPRIKQAILKKKAKVLGGPSKTNDREDVRIFIGGARIHFSSPGNEIVPPANTAGLLVDISAGGACIKIPVHIKLHKKAESFLRLDFIKEDFEISCSILGLR